MVGFDFSLSGEEITSLVRIIARTRKKKAV